MALINCPHCNRQNSSQAKECVGCGRSLQMSREELEKLARQRKRDLRNTLYRYKMLSYVAMALALFGAVPMIWDYARSIDYGFNTSVLNHWGTTWVVIGFVVYAFSRVMMLVAKKKAVP